MNTKTKENLSDPERKLSTSERSVIEKHLARAKAETPVPRLKVMEDGTSISVDHPDQGVGWALVLERFGTTKLDFVMGLITQLSRMTSDGEKVNKEELNFAFSVVTELRPHDQIGALLATQIASVQIAMSRAGKQLVQAETFQEQDSAERMYNKLARNLAVLIDMFIRYRAQGGQNVAVQNNVLVGDGGQAIVANMNAPKGEVPGQPPQGKDPGTAAEPTRSH
jgi:hypothetical protein